MKRKDGLVIRLNEAEKKLDLMKATEFKSKDQDMN